MGGRTVVSRAAVPRAAAPDRVGKTHRSTFTIRVFHRPNMYPQFEVEEIAGTYRLVWSLWHAGATEALPLEQRISNTFEVVD